ncbi:hypothetical protein AB0E67_35755 [Streptomyces sp. NPDC032161]|uniref:hypothetical protein n=1 Tax=unclassified Streptomyces TaxID=2593676 RepID=UPI0033CC69B5
MILGLITVGALLIRQLKRPVLRHCFDSTEQRSCPAGREGGTRLHLTVDTAHPAEPARSWLATGRASAADRPQHDDV